MLKPSINEVLDKISDIEEKETTKEEPQQFFK